MESELRRLRATRRDETLAPQESFTHEELAAILREADRRQQTKDVATLDEALETARELGIDERHMIAAVEKLRAEKAQRAMRRARTLQRRNRLVRFLITMVFVLTIVSLAAGLQTAEVVLFGMSIAAIAMAFRWIRSEIEERMPVEASEGRMQESGDSRGRD